MAINLPSTLAVTAIRFYRRHLSPLKGYSCAHRISGRGASCSSRGLRAFRRASLPVAWALLWRQFDRCALASQMLQERRAAAEPASNGRYLRYQRGEVDCDAAGCNGCDAPGCDAPGCDVCGSAGGDSAVHEAICCAEEYCAFRECDNQCCGGRRRGQSARERMLQAQLRREQRRGRGSFF